MSAFKKTVIAVIFIAALFLGVGAGFFVNPDRFRSANRPDTKIAALRNSPSKNNEAVAEAASKETASYDVAVYGGTPEGVAAAISCSRHGLKVCLVSETETLGGVWAHAQLNQMDNSYSMMVPSSGSTDTAPYYTLTNQGLNESFMRLLGIKKMENGYYDGVFDTARVSPLFTQLLKDNKIDKLVFQNFTPNIIGRTLTTMDMTLSGTDTRTVSARYFIDASENGDLAACAGCPYTLGRGQTIYGTTDTPVRLTESDYGPDQRQMSATLMFRLGGVHWDDLRNISHNGDQDKFARSENAGWGYNQVAPDFNNQTSTANGVMLSGLNLGRQSDGSILVNGLLVFNVNGTLWGSVNDGVRRGKADLPAVVSYLKATLPPFQDAYLIDSANTLYVRESRHFIGNYILSLDSVVRGEQPYDTIARAGHTVDEHPYTPEEARQNLQNYGSLVDLHLQPKLYGIPMRSLLPMRIDNLALVGRTISCTPKAAASARVVSIGISEAQAIGSVIKVAERQGRGLKDLANDTGFWSNFASEMP
ncbi:MAG TPA: FAD-dependent oxidoreductase [Candidatus Aquicultor sp.]|jgi:hypothetical protein